MNSKVDMIVTFRDGYVKEVKDAEITTYGIVGLARSVGVGSEMKMTHIPWEAIKLATEV